MKLITTAKGGSAINSRMCGIGGKSLVITLLLLSVFCGLSFAAVPHLINYQGKLTDSTGKPLADGTYSITFKIYDNTGGSNPLWTENQNITTNKGIFSVLLGGVTALNLAFDKQYYLGIQVGSDPEMRPLQQLASSAYAFTSDGIRGSENVFAGTGSVGIGTPTPATKLEVQGGAIKATGGLIIETRISDPSSPTTGQVWLRTDL